MLVHCHVVSSLLIQFSNFTILCVQGAGLSENKDNLAQLGLSLATRNRERKGSRTERRDAKLQLSWKKRLQVTHQKNRGLSQRRGYLDQTEVM